jgi:hypothetical protein
VNLIEESLKSMKQQCREGEKKCEKLKIKSELQQFQLLRTTFLLLLLLLLWHGKWRIVNRSRLSSSGGGSAGVT